MSNTVKLEFDLDELGPSGTHVVGMFLSELKFQLNSRIKDCTKTAKSSDPSAARRARAEKVLFSKQRDKVESAISQVAKWEDNYHKGRRS